SVGLTNNDLRWLFYKGYVVQAWETTRLDDEQRTFDTRAKILLGDQSCFVLTPAGVRVARALPGGVRQVPSLAPPRCLAGPQGLAQGLSPSWDKDRRALLFGPYLVKHFKVPAPNQEMVLATFQEEHWPPRVDDPLPGHVAIAPKRRLHDTINS